MNREMIFLPDTRLGMVLHIAAILLLLFSGGFGLWQASNAVIGPLFLIYLLPALMALVLIPILAYRAYALFVAYYILERDGIRLRWGLRLVDIPIDEILWVHPASDLNSPLPLPRLRWPGSVLGARHLPGAGKVEFLAANSRRLVLIGVGEKIYAISPANPENFLQSYQRLVELGSLTPIAARSVYPTFLLSRAWAFPMVRLLWLTCLVFSITLFVYVSLSIPGLEQVHLGFYTNLAPGDLAPAVRLFLLPVLNALLVSGAFFFGLFLFRHKESEPLAFLMWGSNAILPVLFLLGAFFILQAG